MREPQREELQREELQREEPQREEPQREELQTRQGQVAPTAPDAAGQGTWEKVFHSACCSENTVKLISTVQSAVCLGTVSKMQILQGRPSNLRLSSQTL